MKSESGFSFAMASQPFKFLNDPPHLARLGFFTHTKKTFELFFTMKRKDFLPKEKRKLAHNHYVPLYYTFVLYHDSTLFKSAQLVI